jgi:putative FmdB family regulatory protein
MPIYAYRCESCSFEDEYLRKVSDPLLTECPKCGKPTFQKQVTAAGFQLKGSGWYVTDFKNKDAKPAAGKEKPAGDGDKPAGDKPAGDKPAADKEKTTEPKKESKSEPVSGS